MMHGPMNVKVNNMFTYHAVKTYVEVEVKILALPTSV